MTDALAPEPPKSSLDRVLGLAADVRGGEGAAAHTARR